MGYLEQVRILYALLCNLLDKQPDIDMDDLDTKDLYKAMEKLKNEIDYNFNLF